MSAVAGGRNAAELLRYFAQVFAAQGAQPTDWNPLSGIRTIGEGVATLAERQAEEMLVRIAEAIPRAAYRSLDFNLLAPIEATGTLAVGRDATAAAQTLAAGARVRVPNAAKEYVTLDTVTLGVGVAGGTTRIRAATAGAFANVSAGTITQLVTPPPGAAWTVANPQALTDGRDGETEEERRLRFAQYIQGIHRATPDALAFGARSAALYDGAGGVLERVTDAQVQDAYGLAKVYIWNGTASPSSSDLLDRTRDILNGYSDPVTGVLVPGYRAAGVRLTVETATITPVPVVVSIYLQDGYQMTQVVPSVTEALLAVFGRQRVGSPRLRLNDLRQAVGLTRGVVDHVFVTPGTDRDGGAGVILVPGTITIYQAS